MADVRLICVIILVSFILYYVTALEVCEDHYVSCPPTSCGGYPLATLYRTNCMKTCGVCTDVNRALGKPTAQSSPPASSYSKRAVDGDINSCTLINGTGQLWWCVDLQNVYDIDSVKLYNTNNLQKRLQSFQVKLGLYGVCDSRGFGSATTCYTEASQSIKDVYTITDCNHASPIPLVGRFIYVTISDENKNSILSLCEVSVTTGTKCSAGYYNYNTTSCLPCDTCKENSCDPDSGVCRDGCLVGYTGSMCQTCEDGLFGPVCRYACSMEGCRGNCDRETGACHECKAGYHGTNCELECNKECVHGRCQKADGSCFANIVTETKDEKPVDEGMDRSVVGVIGVISGIVITCLLILVHFIIIKRHRFYKVNNDRPPSFRAPSVPPETPKRHDSLQPVYPMSSHMRYIDIDLDDTDNRFDSMSGVSGGTRSLQTSMIERSAPETRPVQNKMTERPPLETPDELIKKKRLESQCSQISECSSHVEYKNESFEADEDITCDYEMVRNVKVPEHVYDSK
ncbi:hypothetical protein SNE40_012328 [Patella caerulea]|uniref:ShKT domain-containing protein n=1 Tax=Patella caerulea TaxID=87958 RepID=A0AAN8JRE0_PATCE